MTTTTSHAIERKCRSKSSNKITYKINIRRLEENFRKTFCDNNVCSYCRLLTALNRNSCVDFLEIRYVFPVIVIARAHSTPISILVCIAIFIGYASGCMCVCIPRVLRFIFNKCTIHWMDTMVVAMSSRIVWYFIYCCCLRLSLSFLLPFTILLLLVLVLVLVHLAEVFFSYSYYLFFFVHFFLCSASLSWIFYCTEY